MFLFFDFVSENNLMSELLHIFYQKKADLMLFEEKKLFKQNVCTF
jgi:hypothetical protein